MDKASKYIIKPSKETLEKIYFNEKKSAKQISDAFGVSKKTVLNWMKRDRIKRRDSKTAILEIRGIILPSKNQLEKDLQELSLKLIANKYHTSVGAIITYVKKCGLNTNNWSDARKIAIKHNRVVPWNKGQTIENPKIAKLVDHLNKKHMEKINEAKAKQSITRKKLASEGKLNIWNKGLTKEKDARIMQSVERLRRLRLGKDPWNKFPIPPKEVLEQKYTANGMSLAEIAEEFNTNQNTVQRWLKHYKIDRRLPYSKVRGRIKGKDGHLLDSSYERLVCDWLSNHNISHNCHGFYAKGKRRFKYDFKIDDYTFIEVKGYLGNSKFSQVYKNKEIKKEEWFNKSYFKDSEKKKISILDVQPDKNGRLTKQGLDKSLSSLLYYKKRTSLAN